MGNKYFPNLRSKRKTRNYNSRFEFRYLCSSSSIWGMNNWYTQTNVYRTSFLFTREAYQDYQRSAGEWFTNNLPQDDGEDVVVYCF